MNPNHDSKTVWPGARAARRRLWRITLVLFPLSLVIFALLVGDWKLNVPERTEESRRHLIEWLVILVAAIAVTFLAGLLPTVQRFSGWLFSRRVVRRMLIAFAWLVTVVVLFYAEENWRGWHAWNRYRQPLAAQGVPFDYRAFIPIVGLIPLLAFYIYLAWKQAHANDILIEQLEACDRCREWMRPQPRACFRAFLSRNSQRRSA